MKHYQQILKDKCYYSGAIDGIIGPLSLNATQKFITDEIAKRNWLQPKSEFVYLRLKQSFDNKFNDVCVRFNNGIADMIMSCSTVPGYFWIYNPVTVGGITGTAIACEQQVTNSHTFKTSANWKSLWLGAPYFMQTGAIEIWRDGNKNTTFDKNIKTKGWYGINLHRGGIGSLIDNWSAGCMVVPDNSWFEAIKIFKPEQVINYTLIEI